MSLNVKLKSNNAEGSAYKLSTDNMQEVIDLISQHDVVVSTTADSITCNLSVKNLNGNVVTTLSGVVVNIGDWVVVGKDITNVRVLTEAEFSQLFEVIP